MSFKFGVKIDCGTRQARALARAEGVEEYTGAFAKRTSDIQLGLNTYHHEITYVDEDVMPIDPALAERIMRMLFTSRVISFKGQLNQTAGLLNTTPGKRFAPGTPYLKIDEHDDFVVNESGEW